MKTGVELIAEERQRQIKEKGFDSEHDDNEKLSNIIKAANYYAEAGIFATDFKDTDPQRLIELMKEGICFNCRFPFEWDKNWCKPSENPIRNLVKAGALIAAAIDKLQKEKTC